MLQKDSQVQGRYRVMGLLGEGPTGRVYMVSVDGDDTRLALKEIAFGREPDVRMVQQFDTEASALLGLRHPNLAPVRDYFIEAHAAYMVLDYVPGRTVWDMLSGSATPPTPDIYMPWLRQVAAALEYMHGRSIVFREVEPANVVIQPDGQARLVSFGLGRLFTAPDANPFTAPELAAGHLYETRSDVYSWGVMAYVVASRHLPPFANERRTNPLLPPAPGLTPAALQTLARIMSVDPTLRPDIVDACEMWMSVMGPPPGAAPGVPVAMKDADVEAVDAAARPQVQLKWKPTRPVTRPEPTEPVELADVDPVEELLEYLVEVVDDYEKYVENIGQNYLAAPLVLYYRDEVQDTLEALQELGVSPTDEWRKVVELDKVLRARAATLVNEIGYNNFKQYWIMNDPPKTRWWWYLNRQVAPPLPGPKFWEFWKR